MERTERQQDVVRQAQEIRERARKITELAREMRRRAQQTVKQSRAFDLTLRHRGRHSS